MTVEITLTKTLCIVEPERVRQTLSDALIIGVFLLLGIAMVSCLIP